MLIRVFLFLLGLIFGSFLGALTYRLPRGLGCIKGRSFCPNCKKTIAWYDNIPVLSYFLLLGRCRACKKKISLRYPVIEISTGVVWAVLGNNPIALAVAMVLIVIFVIDIEHQLILDKLVFVGLAILLINFLFSDSQQIFKFLLAGFLSADILLFINLATKGSGMGLGDVKLALLIGSLVGLEKMLVWLFFSFSVGAIVGIILIVIGRATFRERIAFGPFLIIGLCLTLAYAQEFLKLIGFG